MSELDGRTRGALAAALVLVNAIASGAAAQDTVVQPAESARERSTAQPPPPPPAPEPAPAAEPAAPSEPKSTWVDSSPATPILSPSHASEPEPRSSEEPDARAPSYEARAVAEPPPGTLREEQRIGSYAQPRWTAHRRFPTTRIYVRPEGELAFEWWLEQKLNLDDPDQVRYRSQYEFELGLGHRLQVDLYLQTEQEGHSGSFELKAEKLELRWALADWGEIPLNPTLYAELVREHEAPPKAEFKLLLGEELARRLHWGFNLVFEHQLGGELENEYALTTGASYSLLDEVFSLGVEVKFETVDVAGARLTFDNWELLAGPSLAWSPTGPMHVLLVALFGGETEGEQKTALFEPTLILGWEL